VRMRGESHLFSQAFGREYTLFTFDITPEGGRLQLCGVCGRDVRVCEMIQLHQERAMVAQYGMNDKQLVDS